MRKCLLIIFIVIFGLSIKAQTWCPPGAQWHYRLNYPYIVAYAVGYIQLNNIGTVTIANKECANLIGTFYGVKDYPNTPTITANNFANVKTFEESSVIYVYNNTTLSFDTLANFNANIGDKWRMIEYYGSSVGGGFCPSRITTVLDTGHVTINSLYLKKLILKHQYNNWNSKIDTVIEKIACITSFLFSSYYCPSDGYEFGKFVCYSDNNFPLYKKTGFTGSCEYYPTGLNELTKNAKEIKLYPNPTNGILNIELENINDNEHFTAKIINSLGGIIREEEVVFKNKKAIIQTDELFNGVYVLRLLDSARSDNPISVSKRFVIAR